MELSATGMDTNGQLHIAGPGDVLRAGGMLATSGTPILTPGGSLGTGAGTPSIVGNNYAGKITFTTATLSLVAGTVLTLTFADGLTYPNGSFVTFSPANDNFAAVLSTLYVDGNATSTGSVTLKCRLGLGIGTQYSGFYQIIGY